jgi:hypothetical protein
MSEIAEMFCKAEIVDFVLLDSGWIMLAEVPFQFM